MYAYAYGRTLVPHTAALSALAGAMICSAMTWWTKMLAQHAGVLELVQLGGTGGLIVCLFAAVVALWKDRSVMNEMIKEERIGHRKEVADLQLKHQSDLRAVTTELMSELRSQIDTLRSDTAETYRRLDENK